MKFLLVLVLTLFSVTIQAQQTEYVDFKSIDAVIFFNEIRVDSTLFDSFETKFDILKPIDSLYLNAVNMKFDNLSLNGKAVKYKNNGKQLIIYHEFQVSEENELSFLFFASPKKAMYFVGWDNNSDVLNTNKARIEKKQIWTQGQGKNTSNWLPSIDDMNDKIEFDLSVTAPTGYQVISNGKLMSKIDNETYSLWEYDMQKPMSSYLVALVVGKYNKKVEVSKSGIPLEMYYYPEDSMKVEPTYRYSKQMFDFLENEIGVAYPWQNYKQVPVHDFLYAGMENTSATIFSDAFMVDNIGFIDKNYVNVNAHEFAHQWFGDLVTETSGTHHWLQEGFATYYALLAERDIFGADYYYWRLYEYAQELAAQDRVGQSTALLNPKSSSVTFYKKGAWVLHLLREQVGDVAFKKAVKNYLEKHQFKNVETNHFISEVEKASEQDLTEFVDRWLKDKTFYMEEAELSLRRKSNFINEYEMVDCEAKNSKCNYYYLTSGISEQAKRKIISQVPEYITKEVFKISSIKERQAIAQNMSEIPLKLKADYETLLNDKSYLTIEAALYNLWVNFPEDRSKYLNETQEIIGLSDKNVRLLWLTLALVTPDYQLEQKQIHLNELIQYTSSYYNFEIRMHAFSLLESLDVLTETLLENYFEAQNHHNWRLKKFTKKFIEKNKATDQYQIIFNKLKLKNN